MHFWQDNQSWFSASKCPLKSHIWCKNEIHSKHNWTHDNWSYLLFYIPAWQDMIQLYHSIAVPVGHVQSITYNTLSMYSDKYKYVDANQLVSVVWHWWLGTRKSIRPVKKWVMGCRYGYLSGARCRLFVHGPVDATVIPKPHHLLPQLNPDRFYLSGTSLPRLSWKRGR